AQLEGVGEAVVGDRPGGREARLEGEVVAEHDERLHHGVDQLVVVDAQGDARVEGAGLGLEGDVQLGLRGSQAEGQERGEGDNETSQGRSSGGTVLKDFGVGGTGRVTATTPAAAASGARRPTRCGYICFTPWVARRWLGSGEPDEGEGWARRAPRGATACLGIGAEVP